MECCFPSAFSLLAWSSLTSLFVRLPDFLIFSIMISPSFHVYLIVPLALVFLQDLVYLSLEFLPCLLLGSFLLPLTLPQPDPLLACGMYSFERDQRCGIIDPSPPAEDSPISQMN
jgi:hypothetical protein